jgi:hypothetical protein
MIQSAMISRAAFTPIAIALVAATLLTALLTNMCLWREFHHAKWIVDPHPPLGPVVSFLRTIYPFVWIMPLLTFAFACLLHRRTPVPAFQVAWYVSSVAFALFAWFLLIAFSFFIVHTKWWHYLDGI